MAMIPEDEIERIKRDTDLAAIVRSRGIELQRQGGDFVGRCPFHSPDEHPSLHVTPGKRLWRCVSCGATGNVIQFVQKYDGVSFRHAFELLKAALGSGGSALPVPPRTGAPLKKSTVPKLASPLALDADDLALMRQVVDYYHARLKENPAALAYLQKRGIANEEALASRSVLSTAPSACACRRRTAPRARRCARASRRWASSARPVTSTCADASSFRCPRSRPVRRTTGR